MENQMIERENQMIEKEKKMIEKEKQKRNSPNRSNSNHKLTKIIKPGFRYVMYAKQSVFVHNNVNKTDIGNKKFNSTKTLDKQNN